MAHSEWNPPHYSDPKLDQRLMWRLEELGVPDFAAELIQYHTYEGYWDSRDAATYEAFKVELHELTASNLCGNAELDVDPSDFMSAEVQAALAEYIDAHEAGVYS